MRKGKVEYFLITKISHENFKNKLLLFTLLLMECNEKLFAEGTNLEMLLWIGA